ncbi:hypothetical protein ACU21_06065 [Actinobaculum suis]|uniref:hypothetical protein n=1 Tax=Actinobaculum suis TaxID=1657 RepID=UPI0008289E26|nr:hypothetical protein [Actinobaculum suis]OCA94750.1 hypothetical protein ACU21_06065 [Actinobaculum suis]OCA95520.1 hypothetical protein ACU20_03840 [Actinobaculum suis]
MTTPDFTREDFAGLFSELAEVLKSAGHRAQIFVVGGAAMALAYDEQRTQPASLLLPRHRYICLEVAQLALELRGETSADGDGLQG